MGGVTYVQVKGPVPTDEAALHAMRKAVNPCYDIVGRCEYTHANGKTRIRYTHRLHSIEFISVKYSWAELNRWTEILNRFAVSSGNTIGIIEARIDTNNYRHFAVYLNGVTPVKQFPASALRETIVVWSDNVQEVADSLPALLPLLGIPVDAVSVVTEDGRYW